MSYFMYMYVCLFTFVSKYMCFSCQVSAQVSSNPSIKMVVWARFQDNYCLSTWGWKDRVLLCPLIRFPASCMLKGRYISNLPLTLSKKRKRKWTWWCNGDLIITSYVCVVGDSRQFRLDSTCKTAENGSFVIVIYFLELPSIFYVYIALFLLCADRCRILYLYLKTSICVMARK